MRKLTYEIYKGNEKINEVATYKEMLEEKAKGYTIKDKLTTIHEREIFEVYDGENKVKEVTTFKDIKQAKEDGYTLKRVKRVK